MHLGYFFIPFITLIQADIINYSNDEYILIQNEQALLYESFGSIFHVTNLTYYETLYNEEKLYFLQEKEKHSYSTSDFLEIESELQIIESSLIQLEKTRKKRGINEIGTVWKWIAGTPDHDDYIFISNKINDLIENSNKQLTTNSEIFNEIRRLTNLVNSITGISHERIIRKQRIKMIIYELQNILQTITLAKGGILNSHILHTDETREIIQNELQAVTLTDLLDVSTFKIIQKSDLIILYIKYPKINNICTLFETRPISQNDGKLIIENEVALCNNTFISIEECKIEISNIFCKQKLQNTCFINLLNKKPANCTKIKENNKQIDKIRDGAILVSGKHTVNKIIINGTYLITFNTSVNIDNKTYENPTGKIVKFIKQNHFKNYEILEFVNSNDDTLKFTNINFLEKIGNSYIENPKSMSLLTFMSLAIIAYTVHKLILFIQMKKQEKFQRNQEKLYFELQNKINILSKEIVESRAIHFREGGVNGRPLTPLQC